VRPGCMTTTIKTTRSSTAAAPPPITATKAIDEPDAPRSACCDRPRESGGATSGGPPSSSSKPRASRSWLDTFETALGAAAGLGRGGGGAAEAPELGAEPLAGMNAMVPHAGHFTRPPGNVSGKVPCFPHAGFGHLELTGIIASKLIQKVGISSFKQVLMLVRPLGAVNKKRDLAHPQATAKKGWTGLLSSVPMPHLRPHSRSRTITFSLVGFTHLKPAYPAKTFRANRVGSPPTRQSLFSRPFGDATSNTSPEFMRFHVGFKMPLPPSGTPGRPMSEMSESKSTGLTRWWSNPAAWEVRRS
jgi:hypothetical protein